MTTFKQFITEDDGIPIEDTKELIDVIKKQCSEYLAITSPNNQLYRGMRILNDSGAKYVRKNRNPTDTSGPVHHLLDEFFEKDFGHKYRSAAVFATTSERSARRYGPSFHIFPVNGYEMLGSKVVPDLYIEISDIQGRAFFRQSAAKAFLPNLKDEDLYRQMINDPRDFENSKIDELNYKIFQNMDYFQSKNPAKYGECEVMINCPKYFFLRVQNKGWNGSDDIVDAIYK